MRKAMSFLLCLFLFTGLVSAACAQTVSCPEARLILTVPDGWRTVPLSDLDDPELWTAAVFPFIFMLPIPAVSFLVFRFLQGMKPNPATSRFPAVG